MYYQTSPFFWYSWMAFSSSARVMINTSATFAPYAPTRAQAVCCSQECELLHTTVEYLGHMSPESISAMPCKTAAVRRWPVPSNQQELRQFLGLTGYHRHFGLATATSQLPSQTSLAVPLHGIGLPSTKKRLKSSNKRYAAPQCSPNQFGKPFVVRTDTGDFAVDTL
jgi:hypothetical protein